MPTNNIYHITANLPPIGVMPQYHIRNDDEKFERMAKQTELEPVEASSAHSDNFSIEKSFAHGVAS